MLRKVSLIVAVVVCCGGCERHQSGATSNAAAEPVLTALRNRHFATLDQELTADQRSFERDPATEATVDFAFNSFTACNSNDARLLEDWVKADPNSFAPHLARSAYLFHHGWLARGSRSANQTSDAQLNSMEGDFRDGAAEAVAALKIDPALPIAYHLITLAERTSESQQSIYAVAQAGLGQTPASFAIREAFMLALLSRWGGSDDAMERFATESQSWTKENPQLRLLLGFADWDRGDSIVGQDQNTALTYYNRALQEGGDYWRFFQSRGKDYYWLKQHDQARADLDRSAQLNPNESATYEYLAWVASAERNPHEVLVNVDTYRQLAEPPPGLLKLGRWALELQQEAAARASTTMPGQAGGD
jgi:tetratricopeptide (TPR) repeat protein